MATFSLHEIILLNVRWYCRYPLSYRNLEEMMLERGFDHFSFWLKLIEKEIHFISRLKKGAAIKVEQVFTDSYSIRDRLIRH